MIYEFLARFGWHIACAVALPLAFIGHVIWKRRVLAWKRERDRALRQSVRMAEARGRRRVRRSC